MNRSSNYREFNRVKFNEPIQSSIELVTSSFGEIGEVAIYVIDMSASGLRFVSKDKFMVNFLSMYKLKVKLNGKDLVLYGKIIRKKKLINNFFEYGVQFNFHYAQ